MKRPSRNQLIVVAVLAIVGYFLFAPGRGPATEVVTAEQRDVIEVVVASGRLRAVRQSQTGADVAGVVEALNVREGDTVRAGQSLGRLQARDVSARVTQAERAAQAAAETLKEREAMLEQARRDLRRIAPLAAKGTASQAELDRAQSTVTQSEAAAAGARARLAEAQAEIARARPELGKREVLAPFAGVVLTRHVEPGQAVSPSQAWFTIAEMADTELYVETDENNLGKLRVGQKAIAVAPAFQQAPFDAELVQIGPNVDSDRGVVALRLRPKSLPPFALPNMTVDVSIEVNEVKGGIALPSTAVATDAAGSFVLVPGGTGKLARQDVKVLGRNPGWVALQGIKPGTRVVREVGKLAPGARIRVVEAAHAG